MLDFSRRQQRRGAFPNVRRALRVYWEVEQERQTGCGFREAVRRVGRRSSTMSRGSWEYQYRQGAAYDAELRACWGWLYPNLKAETF